MDALGGPNKNFGNLTLPLILVLIFFPSSKAGFLDGLKNAWGNLVDGYPFTSTLQLTNHIKGGPLSIACVLDEGIRKMATIKPGQTFSFEFQERSIERNHMMCFLWQPRRKEIGWFFPLWYGTGPCEKVHNNIWSKKRNICKRQLYPKHAKGAIRFNRQFERFDYEPINGKWG
ncbi:hypothetical protein FCV25MIE_15213, partial [Fagus crenata]